MGVLGSATVISQVICQTCPGNAFPQGGLSGHQGAAELGGGDIYMLLDDGGESSAETITILELSLVKIS